MRECRMRHGKPPGLTLQTAKSSVGLLCCLGCTPSLRGNNSLFEEKNMKERRKDLEIGVSQLQLEQLRANYL